MKIIKTKEVVTEEIDLELRTYYFECSEGSYHKMILEDYDDEGGVDYFLESVDNYNSPYGVRVRKDTIFDFEDLPYSFLRLILEISGKKIEKEEFEQQKQEVINRL